MANTFTTVIPQMLAMALPILRKRAYVPKLVNRDYDAMAKSERGSTIDVPLVSAISVGDVTPGPTPPSRTGLTTTKVQVTLDSWKEAAFAMTDKDLGEVMRGFLPKQAQAAVIALADKINTDIMALGKGFYGYTGTAGTTPFASDLTAAIQARKILEDQYCPASDRRLLLDTSATAAALAHRAVQDASWRGGDNSGLKEGQIGRTLGFDWYEHNNVPQHTLVAAGTALLDDSAARAIGVKTLHMDGFTTKPGEGDIFTIAGDSQTYVVVSSTTLVGTDSDVTFEPGLKVAIPAVDGNEAVTFKATHRLNLAFHRDAMVFVSRPLADLPEIAALVPAETVVDSESGIVLRLEVTREHRQICWAFDVLYGVKLLEREKGMRIAG